MELAPLLCCLAIFAGIYQKCEASGVMRGDVLKETGKINGTNSGVIPENSTGLIECGARCLQENCLGFSTQDGTGQFYTQTSDGTGQFSTQTSEGTIKCLMTMDPDSLSPGVWSVFDRTELDLCTDPPQTAIPFLLRTSNSLSFQRNWASYKAGFGDAENLWMGLEQLHSLTTAGNYGLMVRMYGYDGGCVWAYYSSFRIGTEGSQYQLQVAGYDGRSSAGDSLIDEPSMLVHNGMGFTTIDRENDNWPPLNCALIFKGGWWYNNVFATHLTGVYYPGGGTSHDGIWWGKTYRYPAQYNLKFAGLYIIHN